MEENSSCRTLKSSQKLDVERQKALDNEAVNAKKNIQKAKLDYEMEQARFNSLQKQFTIFNINFPKMLRLMIPF